MRIISGDFKNRRIDFKQINIRPTTDFAKESLFNILHNYYEFEDLIVLDLFAGSGNISYEFASRKVKEITSVDNNAKCINFIKSTQHRLEIKNLIPILTNVSSYLNRIDNKYDLIFADPPYSYPQDNYNKLIERIFKKNILLENGMLILEHSKFVNFEEHKYFYMKKKYGNVQFTFFKIQE